MESGTSQNCLMANVYVFFSRWPGLLLEFLVAILFECHLDWTTPPCFGLHRSVSIVAIEDRTTLDGIFPMNPIETRV